MIVQQSPGVIRAHYAKNGRNIWAMVSPNGPRAYTLNVADAGAVDPGATLARACHVALYGVLFDFNKSTLQPSSDAALQPVAIIMVADKTLKLDSGEVGRHVADATQRRTGPSRSQGLRQDQTRRR